MMCKILTLEKTNGIERSWSQKMRNSSLICFYSFISTAPPRIIIQLCPLRTHSPTVVRRLILTKFQNLTFFEQTLINVKFNAGLACMFYDQPLNCINSETATPSASIAKVVDKSLNVADVASEDDAIFMPNLATYRNFLSNR